MPPALAAFSPHVPPAPAPSPGAMPPPPMPGARRLPPPPDPNAQNPNALNPNAPCPGPPHYQAIPDDRIGQTGRRIFAVSIIAAMVIAGFFVYRAARPATWDPLLEPYVAFVEAERGLTFDHPVNVRWADIAQEIADDQADARDTSVFSTLENDEPVGTREELLNPWSEAYRVLGLVDPNPERALAESVTETLAENAGAFYTPWDETIVLPEGQPEVALSVTIVHELTHALQHQNGMLGVFPDSPDGATARTALIEGDADRIAMAWYWSRTEAEQQAYLDAIGYDADAVLLDPGDSYLATSFYASYEIGLPMVQAIVAADGAEAIDRLLTAKDVGTTERLLDVFGTSDRSSVDAFGTMALPAGAEAADGDLGALVLFQALAPVVGTEGAFDALIGYDDDAFAMFASDGESCVRFAVYFDSDGEAIQFVDILQRSSIPVELIAGVAGPAAQMDLCTPIGDPADQRYGTILPLIVANEATRSHVASGETKEVARCAALAQAATIPIRSAEDFVGWDVLVDEAPQYVEACR